MTEKERIERMKRCNHVFALIKKKNVLEESIRECVKCGLTNKNEADEKFISMFVGSSCISEVTTLFHVYMDNQSSFSLPIKDLSSEELGTNKPYVLYRVAQQCKLSLDIDSEDGYPMIADSIKELSEIVDECDFDLNEVDDLKALMHIYSTRIARTYKKEIK